MKIKTFFLGLVILVSVQSCILDDGDRVPRKTEAGKMIWDATSNVLAGNLYTADLALKLDLWIKAAPEIKDQLEDRYFPGNKLRTVTGVWNITGTPVYIYPDDKSLHTQGAIWKVLVSDFMYEYPSIPRMHISIECIGELKWKVTSYDDEGINGNNNIVAELSGKRVESLASSAGYIYTIKGTGYFNPSMYENDNQRLVVSYIIPGGISFYPHIINELSKKYTYIPYSGSCALVVNDIKNTATNDNILVEVLSGSPTRTVSKITYKGVTETWD